MLFPIRDTFDRPIALGGRVVPSLYGEGEEVPPAKYVNSPETRLFSKSKNLYALNLCRSHVQKQDHKQLTIVEGYTDVIAAWQAGLRNVVAALGTAINEQHVRLIKRFADSITLVLDGDEAGQKKSKSVLDLFVAEDLDLRILSLPEKMDPFDYLMQNGGEPFQQMIDKAPDALGYKIQTETRGIDLLNDTHRASQALDNILKTMARFPASQLSRSAARRMRFDQINLRLARQFQIDPAQIQSRIRELRSSQRPLRNQSQPEQPESRKLDPSRFIRAEAELIQLLFQLPHLLDFAIENVVPDEFQPGPLQDLYREIETCFHEGKDVGYDQLILHLEDPLLKGLVEYLFDDVTAKTEAAQKNPSDFASDPETQLNDVVNQFRNRRTESAYKAKISQLHTGQLDADEEADTLKQLFEYQQQLHNNKNPK